METLTCQQCGESFEVYPSELKRRDRKYCSLACYRNSPSIHAPRPKSVETRRKISRTKKRLYAEGKLINPLLGKKRPDLAQRNRDNAKYTKREVLDLFEQYKSFEGGLRAFATHIGLNTYHYLQNRFKQFIPPYEYEVVVRQKKVNLSRQYRRGRRFEYRVRDHYQSEGYFVLRSPRSAGLADLVAIKKGKVIMIQCKISGYLRPKDKRELYELAVSIGAEAHLVGRGQPPHHPLTIEEIKC